MGLYVRSCKNNNKGLLMEICIRRHVNDWMHQPLHKFTNTYNQMQKNDSNKSQVKLTVPTLLTVKPHIWGQESPQDPRGGSLHIFSPSQGGKWKSLLQENRECVFVSSTYCTLLSFKRKRKKKKTENSISGSFVCLCSPPCSGLSYCSFRLTRGTLAACCLLDVL